MAVIERIGAALKAFKDGASSPSLDNPFWQMMGSSGLTKSRQVVTVENSLQVSAVYACVTLLSETIASLPLDIYEETPDGKRRKREGKLYDLLKNPVGYQNDFEWMENLVGNLALQGNSYHRIGPLRSELDPIHNSNVAAKLQDDRTILYTVSTDDGQFNFDQREILHVKGLATDGVTGLSTVALARETIGAAKAAEEHASTFFGNSAIPGGVLSTKSKMGNEDKRRLRDDFQMMHGGNNKHRVGVFDMELSWQQIGMSNEDAQFLETRKFEINEIARWFRIPPHMIGDVEKSTSWGTGIEQQSIGFVRYTLRPWLKRIEAALNSSLVLSNDGNVFIKFNVEALLRGDSASRSAYYATMRAANILTVNEVRELEDLNPIEGGDTLSGPDGADSGSNAANSPQEPQEDDSNEEATAIMLADVAERLVSCEKIAHDRRSAKRAEDPERFTAWLAEWLTGHRIKVESALKPVCELNKIDEKYRSGMVDNYIMARSAAILSNSEDSFNNDTVTSILTKEVESWIN